APSLPAPQLPRPASHSPVGLPAVSSNASLPLPRPGTSSAPPRALTGAPHVLGDDGPRPMGFDPMAGVPGTGEAFMVTSAVGMYGSPQPQASSNRGLTLGLLAAALAVV